MSCHVMSCHVMSCHVMSCHVMSCHVMSCHVMSTLHYTTLHYTTLHYATLHYATVNLPTPHYTTLQYAWRLRHLLDYNANRQKHFSDLLQSLCILFTALSTLAAVVYGHLLFIGEDHMLIHDPHLCPSPAPSTLHCTFLQPHYFSSKISSSYRLTPYLFLGTTPAPPHS
jgi:hypothetical protein